MDQVELQHHVLGLLQQFSGMEPLKELFWSRLNYDRINQRTTRRGWPEAAAGVLADDPTLLAGGGAHGDFRVLYSRLAKDRLSLADERIVTSKLLKDNPYALFVFSDRSQTNWHFLNVKMAEDEDKRKLFRRVAVGPYEKMRTASQVISQLDLASIDPNLFGLSPLVIQQRHDQAFDVEPVTEEFFKQYHAVFEKVESLIRGFRDQERKRLFTQRLFNRLMFIAFIQKKGWLQFGDNRNQDYLNTLWSDYGKNGNKDMGFYYERLYNLFFHGLGEQHTDVGISNINRGGLWAEYIGKVPYLNGGLFEEEEDDKNGGIKVPDEAIKAILQNLFNHFNFTVTEATPLDIEVAVDPEMLGKVFEELVTGRHETGSYYTPKPIVSFMCREALKGYLESNLPKEKSEAVAAFVDDHDSGGLHNAEAVLEALRRVRACDPACGSGAYLLGMLHELMDLRTCLFSAKSLDPISAYDRKLDIIQKNVYGVDMDAFAVNIARLRLWLSLAVEFDGQNPPPLPNLKFEIEEGDSLGAPGPEPDQMLMWQKEIEEFSNVKAAYIKAHGTTKRTLEQKVLALKQSITSWAHHGNPVNGFDWAVEFAEVFAEGGFDIVVANPPYVRHELITEIKPRLKAMFPEVYVGTADLFVYFYGRALQILREGGMLSFISSNKWFRSNYGANLRQHVAETCHIVSITDFGELPVFKSAATFPMIFIASKGGVNHRPMWFTQVKSLDAPYPDVKLLTQITGSELPKTAVKGSSWTLSTASAASAIARMEQGTIPLDEYVASRLYYGIKTGLNDAFVIDSRTRRELIAADKKSAALIKPLVVGDDIRKWRIDKKDRWLIYSPWDLEIGKYPAVKQHLAHWKSELSARPECNAGRYRWWCMARYASDYAYEFDHPKIIFPDIAKEPRFAFDKGGLYTVNTNYFIASDDLFLLAVLNSSVVWFYCKEKMTVLGDADEGGRLRFFRQFVQAIPIPVATAQHRKRLAELSQRCLEAQGEDCGKWELEIDEEVAGMYGIEPVPPPSAPLQRPGRLRTKTAVVGKAR